MEPSLLPPTSVEPLEYAENEPFNLGRNCTIDDVCDFIVEYINLDVLVCNSPAATIINANNTLGPSLG